jgi:hypothetical protein
MIISKLLKDAEKYCVFNLKIANDCLYELLEDAEEHHASDQMVINDHFLKLKYS